MTSLTFTVWLNTLQPLLVFNSTRRSLVWSFPTVTVKLSCGTVWMRSAEAQGPQRTLHWHANEVTDLAFTSNGQYFVGGGEEAVMVLMANWKWLASNLPRLGDPIHYICISGDDRWAAVSTKDNVIHLVSLTSGSTLTVSKSIRGCITSAGAMVKTSADGSTLLLPGNPGTLQVYDPVKDCVENVLEVAPQNRPTGFNTGSSQKNRKVLEIAKTAVFPLWQVDGHPWTTQQSQSSKQSWLPVWSSGADKTTLGLFWVLSRDPTLIWSPICAFGLIMKPGYHVQHQVPVMVHSNCGRLILNMEFGLVTMLDLITTMLEEQLVWMSMREARSLAVVYGASVTLWRLMDTCLVDVLMTTQTAKLAEARFLRDGSIVAWCPEEGTFVFNRLDGKLCLPGTLQSARRPQLPFTPDKAQFALLVDTPTGGHMGVLTYASESPVPIGFYMMPEQCADFKAVVYVPSPENVRQVRPGTSESHILVLSMAAVANLRCLEPKMRPVWIVRFQTSHQPAQIANKPANGDRVKSLYRAIFESSDGLTQNAALDAKAVEMKRSMAELFGCPQISSEDVLLPLVASHVLPPVSMLFQLHSKASQEAQLTKQLN